MLYIFSEENAKSVVASCLFHTTDFCVLCVCVCVLVHMCIQCLKSTNVYPFFFLTDQIKLELMHCKKLANFFCYFYSSGSTTV